MPSRSLDTPLLLMTMTDIAELAGVQRPVVTKWRQRLSDFPVQAGGDASKPLFLPDDVAAWLLGKGKISRDRAEQELPLFKLAGLAAHYPAGDPLEAVTALICLRYLAGELTPVAEGVADPVAAACELAAELDRGDSLILSEICAIPREAGWAVRLVDDLVEASYNCRDAFEHVMRARGRLGAGGLTSAAVTSELAELIAELSGAPERARRGGTVVVADPAAGPGDLLAAVAPMLAPDGMSEFSIAETDPKLARLVCRRLLVYGFQPGDIRVSVGTDLPGDAADPDVIVTQIPYQPGETRDAVAVLDQVAETALQLSPNRYGVILGPASVLTGELALDSNEWRVRTDLIKGFMVEAAIRLPGGLVPFRPAYETALWIVTQARDSRWRGRLLIGDVSDRQLTHDVISDLVEDVTTWRREGYRPSAHSRKYCQQIAIADLLEPPSLQLILARPGSPRERADDAAGRVTQLIERGVDLDRIGATAVSDRRHVPIEAFAAADLRPKSETVGALVKDKRLTLHQGTRIKPEHITKSGHHLVFGSDEVLGIQRPERRIDRATLARYPSAKLTRPGDVLVAMLPRPAAIVDVRGFAIAELGIRILRISDAEAELFTPRVLAALLFADGSGNRVSGAVRTSCPLEGQRLPLLEPDQVRGLDFFLAEIDARRELACRELDLLAEAQDAAVGGLISGTLTLIPNELIGQD
jgi:hypothetical protein